MKKHSIKYLESKLRWLYPIWIAIGVFSIVYVPSIIFDENDIVAMAANVAEHNMLLRLSIIGNFISAVIMIFVSYYFYLLFESVNRNRALLVLILALISVPIIGFEAFKIVAAGSDDADYIYKCLNISRNAQTVAEVFWGLWLFPLGMLVIESKYFPKLLGYALVASCCGYLFAVLIKVVFPDQRDLLLIADILAFGELIFGLWIVFKGIKLESTIS